MRATKIHHYEWDVDRELEKFGRTRQQWLAVVARVVSAKLDAVPDDPRSAAGLFAYIYGVRHTRFLLSPGGWQRLRDDNIEASRDPATGLQVIYQSVDCAGLIPQNPKAIQGKGAGARRQIDAAHGGLFPDDDIPPMVGAKFVGDPSEPPPSIWYFCVSITLEPELCVGAELSLPAPFKGDNFGDFHERIMLQPYGPWRGETREAPPAEPFEAEPKISRK